MRILGVDYGDRNVGLALSDALGITAQPLMTYRLTGRDAEDRSFFADLVRKHGIGEIVLGYPLRMDGSSGTRVEKTRAFAAWLGAFLAVPVRYWDERLTTFQARGVVHEQGVRPKAKKAVLNQVSAAIILQGYLDSRRSDAGLP
jgi:putative Holliday junction resolvase